MFYIFFVKNGRSTSVVPLKLTALPQKLKTCIQNIQQNILNILHILNSLILEVKKPANRYSLI